MIIIPYSEYGIAKHLAFVGAVKEKNGKFCFDKITPDVSLNREGNTKDVDHGPFATFYFDNIDGLYFALGEIFDDSYKPYYQGRLVALQKENIYTVVKERERPEIFVTN